MSTGTIISLIMSMAPVFGIDPYIAVAVAHTESSMNPKAIGSKGEVGLFQIMPAVYKSKGYTKTQMEVPLQNIYVGLEMLRDVKMKCAYKGALTSLVCYNTGIANGRKIKRPAEFPYVKKVTKKVIELMQKESRMR